MRPRALIRLRLGFLLLLAAVLVPLFFLLRDVRERLEAQQALRHRIVAERIFDEMERELTELLAREGERPSSAYDASSTRVASWAPFVVGYYTRDAAGLHVIAREQLGAARAQRMVEAVQAAHGGSPRTPPAAVRAGGGLGTSASADPARGVRADSAAQPAAALDSDAVPSAQSQGMQSAGPTSQPARTGPAAPASEPRAAAPATNAASQPQPKAAASERKAETAKSAVPSKKLSHADSEAVLRQLNRGAEQRDDAKGKARRTEPTTKDSWNDPLNGL